MQRYTFLLLLLVTSWNFSQAQTDSLINSGYHIARGKTLIDSGLYEKAILEFQFVNPRDTNYVYSLTELASAYFSNRQYDEAITTTVKALLKPSPFRAQLLTTQGMSYAEMGQYDNAKAIFETGQKEFPFYISFLTQYGKMLYAQKQYVEAEKYFFQAMETYPFNSTSHLYLALISIKRGEKTRGMMAMGIYMALNNTNNTQLVTLERFVKNELTDEFSIPPSSDNPFARLDEIIRSEIAMDDRYKTKIPINVGVVQQYQLLFDQLAIQEFSGNDQWIRIYLPIYKSLIKANQQEAFVYHILKSTSIKLVPEWTKKNEKTLTQFYTVMNTAIPVVRAKKTLPESWGYREPVSCWFSNTNGLQSIGQANSKNETIGLWYYFHENGSLKARGTFNDQGKKIGFWKYYNTSGIQSDTENFDTGERTHFYEQGSMKQKYVLKNDKFEGELFNYFPCGNVQERLQYRNGLREGNGEIYSIQGTVVEKYNFVKDSLQGEYLAYYETGELKQRSTFERGKRNKIFTTFHQNGKISSQGDYVMDIATGPWKNYHDNGNLKEAGQYKDDLPVGKFTFYDHNGTINETRNYNEKGEYHGENLFFHNGLLHYRLNYNNNLVIEITYYDRKSKVIATYANDKGTFACKGYFPTGELRSEFQYTEGIATGTWKYYYRTGNLESVYEYNGALNGKGIEYFPDKTVKTTSYYEDGELHGLYEAFTEYGRPRMKVWYQYGQPQQQWTTYYPNGKIKTDEYYLNGELTGASYYYDPEGKIISITEYEAGRTLGIQHYNEKGEPNSVVATSDGGRMTVTSKFKSGSKSNYIEILCGNYHGNLINYLPDGKTYMARQFANDQRHGTNEKYFPDGKLESKARYRNGKAVSYVWYYPNKTIETLGNYAEDERDSLWTYYHENGKLSFISAYQHDKKHGTTKVFSPEGQLILEKLYDEGDLIAYRPVSVQDTSWISFNGNGTIQSHYPDGKLAFEESYLHGLLNGLRKAYFVNGALLMQENYSNGQSEGVFVENYQNGKPRVKKNYKMDEAHGRWEYYSVEGMLERIENYSYGQLQGPTEFFSNGKKVKEVKFWYGLVTD